MAGAGPLAQVQELSAMLAMLLAPLPLVAALDAQGRPRTATASEHLLGIAVGWTVGEITIAVVLGLLGELSLGPMLLVCGLIATGGVLLRPHGVAPPSFTRNESVVLVIAVLLGTTLLLSTVTTAIVETDS